jgi:hypothetical protein
MDVIVLDGAGAVPPQRRRGGLSSELISLLNDDSEDELEAPPVPKRKKKRPANGDEAEEGDKAAPIKKKREKKEPVEKRTDQFGKTVRFSAQPSQATYDRIQRALPGTTLHASPLLATCPDDCYIEPLRKARNEIKPSIRCLSSWVMVADQPGMHHKSVLTNSMTSYSYAMLLTLCAVLTSHPKCNEASWAWGLPLLTHAALCVTLWHCPLPATGSAHRMFLIQTKEVAPAGAPGGRSQDFDVLGATGNGKGLLLLYGKNTWFSPALLALNTLNNSMCAQWDDNHYCYV